MPLPDRLGPVGWIRTLQRGCNEHRYGLRTRAPASMIPYSMPTYRWRKLWLLIGWLLVASVTYLSLVPDPPTLPVSAGDKVGHVLAYGTLMLWFLQLNPPSRWAVLAAALVTIGIVLELVQGLSAARSAELLDVLANTAGVLCGWLLGHTRAATALQALERTLTRISI